MLKVDNISLYYGAAQALRGVTISAEPGKVMCVLGRNGVGKTSLLRAMVGQYPIASGSITLNGDDITGLKPYERARKGIADRLKSAQPEPPPPKPSLQRTKILIKSNHRNFIVDAQDVVYATIDDGLITVVATGLEGQSNYRTIEELQSNLDPDVFWRVHRSYLVNIHRIREVIPWFKSSFQLRMDDKKQTEIPVSRVQTKRLRALLKL